jgi:hypothetical protein
MARKVQVRLLDDLDGTTAEETLKFGLDGINYEIDLNAQHADELRAGLARYVLKARRLGRERVAVSSPTRAVTSTAASRDQNRAIREWARTKGIELSERGRIPAHVVQQFEDEAGR